MSTVYVITTDMEDVDAMGNVVPNIHPGQLNAVNASNDHLETLEYPNHPSQKHLHAISQTSLVHKLDKPTRVKHCEVSKLPRIHACRRSNNLEREQIPRLEYDAIFLFYQLLDKCLTTRIPLANNDWILVRTGLDAFFYWFYQSDPSHVQKVLELLMLQHPATKHISYVDEAKNLYRAISPPSSQHTDVTYFSKLMSIGLIAGEASHQEKI